MRHVNIKRSYLLLWPCIRLSSVYLCRWMFNDELTLNINLLKAVIIMYCHFVIHKNSWPLYDTRFHYVLCEHCINLLSLVTYNPLQHQCIKHSWSIHKLLSSLNKNFGMSSPLGYTNIKIRPEFKKIIAFDEVTYVLFL